MQSVTVAVICLFAMQFCRAFLLLKRHTWTLQTSKSSRSVFFVDQNEAIHRTNWLSWQFWIRNKFTAHTGGAPAGKLPKGEREESQAWLAGQYKALGGLGNISLSTFADEHAPPQ